MLYRQLGRTGLIVSYLAMGVLTIGPLQRNLAHDEGARVIASALLKGVNFLDTAQIYKTYPYIRKAINITGIRPILCSKSYAVTGEEMRVSLEEALDETGLNRLGIFMLHEQESEHTLKGHREALQYLVKARDKKWIQAVGLSTHSIKGVLAGIRHPDIQVIHPIFNRRGLGIMDGSREQMLAAMRYARSAGKGIYAMKIFGGGNLYKEARASLDYVRRFDFIDSIAIGMASADETGLNIGWVEGRDDPRMESQMQQKRQLHLEDWCIGCGLCVEHCRYQALKIEDGRMVLDHDACLLCGYCAFHCPEFCIKIL